MRDNKFREKQHKISESQKRRHALRKILSKIYDLEGEQIEQRN